MKFCFVHCPSVSQLDSPMTSSAHKKPNKKLIGVMHKPQVYFTCPLSAQALYTLVAATKPFTGILAPSNSLVSKLLSSPIGSLGERLCVQHGFMQVLKSTSPSQAGQIAPLLGMH